MLLSISSSNDPDVIREEVARYRALSPEQQVQVIAEVIDLHYSLAARTGRLEEMMRLMEEEEERGRIAVKEFIARHKSDQDDADAPFTIECRGE